MSRRNLNLLMSMEDSDGVGQKMLQLVIRISTCSGLMPGGRGRGAGAGVKGACARFMSGEADGWRLMPARTNAAFCWRAGRCRRRRPALRRAPAAPRPRRPRTRLLQQVGHAVAHDHLGLQHGGLHVSLGLRRERGVDGRRQVGAVQVQSGLAHHLELELGVLLDVHLGMGGRGGQGRAGRGGAGRRRVERGPPCQAGVGAPWEGARPRPAAGPVIGAPAAPAAPAAHCANCAASAARGAACAQTAAGADRRLFRPAVGRQDGRQARTRAQGAATRPAGPATPLHLAAGSVYSN
jgi:hypothetical protein